MNTISYHVIRKRKNCNNYCNDPYININTLIEGVYTSNYNTYNIEEVFKNWKSLDSDSNIAFNKVFNIFKEICNNVSNKSLSNNVLNLFKENVLYKVNDSKKVKNIIESCNIKDNDIYKSLLENINDIIIMDRIIKNEKSLNKKLNMNVFFKEANLLYEDTIENAIFEACDKINSLPIKFGTKYTVGIENIKNYLDNISHTEYSNSRILETVTDYFLFNINSDENLKSIINIIENTKSYSSNDKQRFNFLNEEYIIESDNKTEKQARNMLDNFKKKVNKEPSTLKTIISSLYTKSPNMVIDELPNIFSVLRNIILIGGTFTISAPLGILTFIVDKFISMKLKREKAEKMLTKFKAEKKKMKTKLNSTEKEEQKKKLEEYIKKLDTCIDKLTEYRDSLYSERENNEREIEIDDDDDSFDDDFNFDDFKFESLININNNEKDRISLEEYYSKYHNLLCKSLSMNRKILNERLRHNKYATIIESTEIDNIYNRNISIDNFIAKDKITIPIAIINATSIREQSDINSLYNSLDNIKNMVNRCMHKSFSIIEDSDILYLTLDHKIKHSIINEVNNNVIYRPDLINMSILSEGIDNINNIIESINNSYEYTNDMCKYISEMDSKNIKDINYLCNYSIVINTNLIRDTITNIRDNNRSTNNLSESTYLNSILEQKFTNNINTLDDLYYQSIIESTIPNTLQVLNELSLTNSLKLAREKLKNTFEKLTDKEKIVSKRLDDSIENFKRKVEVSLTNKNRESVIKSSILPSASTCFKIILGAGVIGYFVSPFIAIVGVLGGLAVSKAGNIKERQMILDEINIQIELIDKKKQIAENNNDVKSLEALMQMEAKLKRERQRIKYKLKDYSVLPIDSK